MIWNITIINTTHNVARLVYYSSWLVYYSSWWKTSRGLNTFASNCTTDARQNATSTSINSIKKKRIYSKISQHHTPFNNRCYWGWEVLFPSQWQINFQITTETMEMRQLKLSYFLYMSPIFARKLETINLMTWKLSKARVADAQK